MRAPRDTLALQLQVIPRKLQQANSHNPVPVGSGELQCPPPGGVEGGDTDPEVCPLLMTLRWARVEERRAEAPTWVLAGPDLSALSCFLLSLSTWRQHWPRDTGSGRRQERDQQRTGAWH